MGTTRMSTEPRRGVVDDQGRVSAESLGQPLPASAADIRTGFVNHPPQAESGMTVAPDLFELFRAAGRGVIVPNALGAVLEHALRLTQGVTVALVGSRDDGLGVGPMPDDKDQNKPYHRLVKATPNDQITRKRVIHAHDRG